ncbi:hypothetical protein I5Q34_32565 [Streptomyces sp. AV19]|uniref:hypothetical protein n=1 Tax=Streptomyces sp. AV19 TaxID=2793068 RepID=UPI0018FE64D4|nr:hypothetical protein [Streptomyces sp. AV19]MBH1938940.1 hypothetical protein [Streptomyces sp. AV19]MDG4536822.1 hypothetical protein [Streptomyces sp. AV19]
MTASRHTHQPNTQLAVLIRAAGCSYEALARTVNIVGREAGEELHYHAPSVHQWLHGAVPRDAVPLYIAEALSRRLDIPITLADIGMAPSGNEHLDVGLRWTTDAVADLVILGRAIVERRDFIQRTTYSLTALLHIPGWHEIAARGQHAARSPRPRIGTGDVDAVRQMTRAFSDIDHAYGSGRARTAATAYLANDVAAYLRADGPDAIRLELYAAAADLTYLVAWMSWDAEEHGLAQRQYTLALRLAAEADSPLMYATVLRGMCVQASDLGHHRAAERLGNAALDAAGGHNAPERTTAFIASRLAVAHAGNGDRRAAHTWLKTAERYVDRTTSRGEDAFHISGFQHASALAHHHLHDLRQAEEAMRCSNQTRPGAERRSRAISNARLAEIQLDRGHLDEACATWSALLDDAALVRSQRVTTAVNSMVGRLRPHQRHPAADALRHRAATLV